MITALRPLRRQALALTLSLAALTPAATVHAQEAATAAPREAWSRPAESGGKLDKPRPPQVASGERDAGAESAALTPEALVETALAALESEAAGRLHEDWKAVRTFYQKRDFAPLWLTPAGFAPAGREAARRLSEAGDDGLDPEAFVMRPPHASDDLATRAVGEVAIVLAATRYAREARQGRIPASSLGELVADAPKKFDPAGFLAELAGSDAPAELLEAQNPPHPQFHALREKLRELRRQTAAVPAHDPIPDGPSLKLGMRDPAVPALRARLGVDMQAGADETVFDPGLVAAVRTFQEASGLTVDGVVGPRTREMLNAPVSVTAADLIVNMERWRWLPRDLGRHHVFVNVPEFRLRVLDDGKTSFETRVIVGKERNRTPVFSDEIEYVDVNPYWNVPASIAVKEFLPEIRKDPYFFDRRGIQVLYTGGGRDQLIDPYSVDWSRVNPANMPFRFRQPPGEDNALGRVKFMFPNKHAVYLHDTPSRSLFKRSERALSHGCVRVEDPVSFADALLQKEEGLNGDRIKRMIGGGANGSQALRAHVPVHLAYFTLWADGEGNVRRWRDVYAYDADMKRLLGFSS